jgi:hypothetical protein
MRAPKKPNPPGRRAERNAAQTSWVIDPWTDSKGRRRGTPYLVARKAMEARFN